MKIFLALFLLIFQKEVLPDKWECGEDLKPPAIEQLAKLKPTKLKERIVSCAVPRPPENVNAQGYVTVRVIINEDGDIQCARIIHGHPIFRRVALDAAKKWKFKPLVVEGEAKPYISSLTLFVSWRTEEAGEQCPKEKRRS
jgi:TonB family protein